MVPGTRPGDPDQALHRDHAHAGWPAVPERVRRALPVAVSVVETDGSIELVDTLKSAYEGAAATRLHVFRDSFDSALMLAPFAARQIGVAALSTQCRACDIHRVCGGGLYPHRYRAGRGFRNPSVFCADLLRLITHVRTVMANDLAQLTGSRG